MTEFEALIEDIRNHGVREVLNDEEVIGLIKELEVTSKAYDIACVKLYQYLSQSTREEKTLPEVMEFIINMAEKGLEKRR